MTHQEQAKANTRLLVKLLTECFCFTNQSFEAGEGRDMPLRSVIDPRLSEDINTMSLSYTFFDITQTALK
jgi:cytochrome c oxidase assembly protein subunit 11